MTDAMMERKPNQDLRDLMRTKGVYQYAVAEAMNVSTAGFQRIMQRKLPDWRREQILKAIDDLTKG